MRLFLLATLICAAAPAIAQRPLCSQFPPAERDRARAAGLCRDPAPIIDVAPRGRAEPAALPVPNVVGMTFDDAKNRLSRFTLQRSYRAAAEAGGTVLAQSPMAPATLPAGAPVGLVLSDGSLVRVPRVTNININDARQRLQKDLDLKVQPVVVTSDLRVGTVIAQQPVEGTLVKRGSSVQLHVSAGQEGPELIDVPNVVGMSFDRAKARLPGFSVERAARPRSEQPNSAPEGQVVEQMPRASTRAVKGSVIVLTVSSAPRAVIEIFEMPDVVGRSYADAARALAEFKVTRTAIESAEPRDQIVTQTPAAGSALTPGAAVALQVSAGSHASAATATTNAPKAVSARGVLAGVMGISAAVVLGLIIGGLVMRQWLSRQRAAAAANDAITALSPLPAHGITAVDILLEDETDAERERGKQSDSEPPHTEPQTEKSESEDAVDSEDNKDKEPHPGQSL